MWEIFTRGAVPYGDENKKQVRKLNDEFADGFFLNFQYIPKENYVSYREKLTYVY